MQVTHINHDESHAVVGGGAAQAFAITQNAEFFEVLSSTLYSNKKLAVVREVLCNAWDAHLMVNRLDRPVQISLSDAELEIRDFGPGISPEMIMEIYCTYGNSTKTNDGVQTGGFGLGSKAPFAYSDHFTVTSCFDGKRTVYAASRGSVETDGRPDLRAMVSVPCKDETGVSVKIPLQPRDHSAFATLVRDLVRFGGINATLNGQPLNRIDFDKSELPFVILNDHAGDHQRSGSSLYVRYGSVVYPVSLESSGLSDTRNGSNLNMLTKGHRSILLLAPPNSMGVTPSRESLSYTAKTIATIKDLVRQTSAAVAAMKPEIAAAAKADIVATPIDKIAESQDRLTLVGAAANLKMGKSTLVDAIGRSQNSRRIEINAITREEVIKVLTRNFLDSENSISGLLDSDGEEIARHLMERCYAAEPWRKRFFNRLAETARIASRFTVDNGYHRYAARRCKLTGTKLVRSVVDTECRHVTSTFEKQLAYLEATFGVVASVVKRRWHSEPLVKYETSSLYGALCDAYFSQKSPLRFVIVANNMRNASEATKGKEMESYARGEPEFFLYLRARKSVDMDALKAHLQKIGMPEVLDCFETQKGQERDKATGEFFRFATSGNDAMKRIKIEEGETLPPVYMQISDERLTRNKGIRFENTLTAAVMSMFPHIAIARNATEAMMLSRRGSVNAYKAVAAKLTNIVSDDAIADALITQFNLSTFVPTNLPSITYLIGKVGFKVVAEPLGVKIPEQKPAHGLSDDVVTILEHVVQGHCSSKGGPRYLTPLMRTITDTIERVFTPIKEALSSKDLKNLDDYLPHYYHAPNMNQIVLLATYTATVQAMRLQHALNTERKE